MLFLVPFKFELIARSQSNTREKNGRNLSKNTCYYFTKNVQHFIETVFGMASNFSNSLKVLLILILISLLILRLLYQISCFFLIRFSNSASFSLSIRAKIWCFWRDKPKKFGMESVQLFRKKLVEIMPRGIRCCIRAYGWHTKYKQLFRFPLSIQIWYILHLLRCFLRWAFVICQRIISLSKVSWRHLPVYAMCL